MNLRLRLLVCVLVLLLTGCNISVTSFPASPAPVADATEIPPTPYPDTPTAAPHASDTLPLGGIKADLIPLNMQTAWVGGVTYAPGTVYLYRTDDAGHSWSVVNLGLPTGAENAELGIDKDQLQFVSAQNGFL